MSACGLDMDALTGNTHKLYSVTRLDVLKLGDLHLGQVMKRFLIFLSQQS